MLLGIFTNSHAHYYSGRLREHLDTGSMGEEPYVKNYIPMFFTKRGISDENDKKIQSNIIVNEANQNTKIGVRTLGVNMASHF